MWYNNLDSYQLNPNYKELTLEDLHVLEACSWLVYHKATIKETALKNEYSYTTFWRRIHKECRELSPELYHAVLYRIDLNKRKRRPQCVGRKGVKERS